MENMNTNVTVLKVSPTGPVTGSIMPHLVYNHKSPGQDHF